MAKRKHDQRKRVELPRRAESKLPGRPTARTTSGETRELEQVIHELQIHQTGRAMHNRELGEAQQTLEATRDGYAHLYDLAADTFKGRDTSPALLPRR